VFALFRPGKKYDTTSFGQKSICRTSFSQHILVMSAGEKFRTSNVTVKKQHLLDTNA
jgi:hypothetical protein